jgi:Bacterial regulatory helix-turn-helix protein, lysR family
MTLEQLRVFVAVAERQHVTRAAEALNIDQSAVSAYNLNGVRTWSPLKIRPTDYFFKASRMASLTPPTAL